MQACYHRENIKTRGRIMVPSRSDHRSGAVDQRGPVHRSVPAIDLDIGKHHSPPGSPERCMDSGVNMRVKRIGQRIIARIMFGKYPDNGNRIRRRPGGESPFENIAGRRIDVAAWCSGEMETFERSAARGLNRRAIPLAVRGCTSGRVAARITLSRARADHFAQQTG